jgi:allophanate hydrolase subunit 2
MNTRLYASQIGGWVAGRRLKAGDTLILTEDQARHEPVVPVALQVTAEAAETTLEDPVQGPNKPPSRRRKAKAVTA